MLRMVGPCSCRTLLTKASDPITRFVHAEIDERAAIHIFSLPELESLISSHPAVEELIVAQQFLKYSKLTQLRATLESPPLDKTLGTGIGILMRFMRIIAEIYPVFLIQTILRTFLRTFISCSSP